MSPYMGRRGGIAPSLGRGPRDHEHHALFPVKPKRTTLENIIGNPSKVDHSPARGTTFFPGSAASFPSRKSKSEPSLRSWAGRDRHLPRWPTYSPRWSGHPEAPWSGCLSVHTPPSWAASSWPSPSALSSALIFRFRDLIPRPKASKPSADRGSLLFNEIVLARRRNSSILGEG